MKYLFILTLFINLSAISQNKINENDYVNFIYSFLIDNNRDQNSHILNVHYNKISSLTLNHLKSLKGKDEIKDLLGGLIGGKDKNNTKDSTSTKTDSTKTKDPIKDGVKNVLDNLLGGKKKAKDSTKNN